MSDQTFVARWFRASLIAQLREEHGSEWAHHLPDEKRQELKLGNDEPTAAVRAQALASEKRTVIGVWCETKLARGSFAQFLRYYMPATPVEPATDGATPPQGAS